MAGIALNMASTDGPGRLGDPNMTLASDPRCNSTLLAAMKKHNIHEPSYLTSELTPSSAFDAIKTFVLDNEAAIEGLYNRLDYTVSDPSSSTPISRSEEVIASDSDHQMKLIIYRPSNSCESPLPAVVYFHGGGMVILSTENPMHTFWAEALARTGMVVIMVDYRNALTHTAYRPFPTGLNDCVAAVRWIDGHRARLGIDKLVLQGESGGGNLALATAIRAKREGWLGAIAGVCATVPYISGAYGMPLAWRRRELPSLVECDGYLISCATSVLNARVYDRFGQSERDPLAWPYWVDDRELNGLPPHLIVTNELDPLRDEGNAYYRKLASAGVSVVGKVNLGLIHEGDLFLRHYLPDAFRASLWEVKTFVDRV